MLQKIDSIRAFKVTRIISLVLVSVGLFGLIAALFGFHLFNYDVDFVGGTTLQFEMYTQVDSALSTQVEKIFEDVTGFQASSVTKAGDQGTQVLIKSKELDSEIRDEIFEAVRKEFNLPAEDLPIKSDYVSASVGADLRSSAVKASVIAVVLILIYITIRFEFRSALAAICALVHDLLVMLTVYVIFQIPFNMNFIAAALTILGYSINATIIIFDRIRANRKLYPKEQFADVVNMSIRQTMPRSVNTTLTTLFSIIMLVIFGVSSIRTFAVPVAVGVICGCYSSVFVAGPVWNWLVMKAK